MAPSLATRVSSAVGLVIALGAADVAHAHFVLYLQGEPGAYVESGIKRFTDADGTLTGYGTAGQTAGGGVLRAATKRSTRS